MALDPAKQFTIKIRYDGDGGVKFSIEGNSDNNLVLGLLAQATGNFIKKAVEETSHKDAFNFVMTKINAEIKQA